MRISRLTGKAEWLIPGQGWLPIEPLEPPKAEAPTKSESLRILNETDRAKINSSKLQWHPPFLTPPFEGSLNGLIHNGTDYILSELVFRVEIYNKGDGKKIMVREYGGAVHITPSTIGEFQSKEARAVFDDPETLMNPPKMAESKSGSYLDRWLRERQMDAANWRWNVSITEARGFRMK